jgi:hypothetical protein
MINLPSDPLAGIGGASINLNDNDNIDMNENDNNSVSLSQIVPLVLPTQDSSSDESDADEPVKQTPIPSAKTTKTQPSKTKVPKTKSNSKSHTLLRGPKLSKTERKKIMRLQLKQKMELLVSFMRKYFLLN